MPKLHIRSTGSLPNYGSHLPVLCEVLRRTTGAVLEMGMGISSTPVMHWFCALGARELVSYDDSPDQAGIWSGYAAERFPWHRIVVVTNWDTAQIERPWDVALVDHSPGERRPTDVARLAPYARYVILHDADGRDYKNNRIKELKTLFKWHYVFTDYRPHTAVLSNFVDLTDFHV